MKQTGYKWSWRDLSYISEGEVHGFAATGQADGSSFGATIVTRFKFKLSFLSYWLIYWYHGPEKLFEMSMP